MRSANTELAQGATDGSYKQVVKDRGGVVEMATYDSHRDLSVPGALTPSRTTRPSVPPGRCRASLPHH